ncbi:sn-1 acyl-lipid omega-3 desaturase (ferredoxin)-like [Haliotis asinina]|uniref:sn-1 acyl-lipid omega-3 desaturase (ferredoxin)-like n=1 Tax=Haliotis asinina TaxID=109174 RepID=UPI0035327C9B
MAQRQTTSGTATISATEDLATKKFPSIIDIKRQIPSYCFEASVSTSLYYAAKDLVLVLALYLATMAVWYFAPTSLCLALTPVYWLLQGTMFMAIFVVGHDCGHGSFSNNELLNDCVGVFLHSFVMTPYYSWKISHRVHHKNTGNIDKDEIFFPLREKADNGRAFLPGFGLGLGWFMYLVLGYKHRTTKHFNPFDPIYARHILGVCISLAYLVMWSIGVYSYAQVMGFCHVLYYYGVPVFVFASFLVIVTFLHHTEEQVPWYVDGVWDNVRGQVSSIDRDYGWCHDIIHNIGTHQIHHLFPKIPHYNLEEATRHYRKAFPDLVHIRNDPILPSFARMFIKYCKQHIVDDHAKVHVYN